MTNIDTPLEAVLKALRDNQGAGGDPKAYEITLRVRVEGLEFSEGLQDNVAKLGILPTAVFASERIEVPLSKVVSIIEAPEDISSIDAQYR